MPLEDIGNNTRNSLANINAVTIRLDSILKKLDESPSAGSPDAVTELRDTLSDLHRLLDPDAPLQTELRQTLKETTASARSIRSLADTLDNQPESIIRGKAE
jgi:paraquat-inducible protein B